MSETSTTTTLEITSKSTDRCQWYVCNAFSLDSGPLLNWKIPDSNKDDGAWLAEANQISTVKSARDIEGRWTVYMKLCYRLSYSLLATVYIQLKQSLVCFFFWHTSSSTKCTGVLHERLQHRNQKRTWCNVDKSAWNRTKNRRQSRNTNHLAVYVSAVSWRQNGHRWCQQRIQIPHHPKRSINQPTSFQGRSKRK